MSTRAELALPEGISMSIEGNGVISIKGPHGTCIKDFSNIRVKIGQSGEGNDRKITIESFTDRRDDVSIVNTARRLIMNMFKGVTSGWTYKLKVAYSHFPITISVKGDKVLIENFYGERVPRIASITSPNVKVSASGDDVVVEGPCLESVSQTAGNIEQATRVRRKDVRVFLDGVYIYEKA